jgi:uncharacterized protein YjbJ (UPF0337 family)
MGELTDKASGKAKEVMGAATGDRGLEAEGKAQNFRGKLKERFESFKTRLRDVVRAPPRQRSTY